MGGDEEEQDRGPREPPPDAEDHAVVVARLRAELEAARSQVREAWERYRRDAGGPGLHAVAPALVALLSQAS